MNKRQKDVIGELLTELHIDEAAVRLYAKKDAQIAALLGALEQAIHEIKMVHWMKFPDATFEEVAEKNPVIIAARAAIAATQGEYP